MVKKTENLFLIPSIGILSGIYLYFGNYPASYSLLPLLPLTYSLLNIIFQNILVKKNINCIFGNMFNGVMLLRTVIMPILIKIGGYNIINNYSIENNIPKAIIIFIYEIICEYTLYYYFLIIKKNDKNKMIKSNIVANYKYSILLILLIISLCVCLFLAPMSILYYRPIFGITNYEFTGFDSRNIIKQYAINNYKKFGLITFRYIANICRVIIPAIILIKLKKTKLKLIYIKIITIVLIFIFDLLLVDDTIATSIINSIITLLFYNKLYSSKNRIKYYFIISFISVIGYFALRLALTKNFSHYSNNISRISSTAQAYFLGIRNIAAGFNIKVDSFNERIKLMVYEVLKGIPYANTMFKLDTTNISYYFNNINDTVGQIVPAISSGGLYFSYIFAPIYPIVFLYISIKASVNIDRTDKPLLILSNIIICIYAIMGISMYSPEATWSFIFCIGIPIKIFSIIFE